MRTVLKLNEYQVIEESNEIIRLKAEKGYAGYGLYCALMELLWFNNLGVMECDYPVIAYHLHTDIEQVKSLVEDYDLFRIKHLNEQPMLYSPAIVEQIKAKMQEDENKMEFYSENYLN